MPLGQPFPCSLRRVMADKGPVWDSMVASGMARPGPCRNQPRHAAQRARSKPSRRRRPASGMSRCCRAPRPIGAHHGPFETPAKERDPRYWGPNFYHDQEDWLRGRAAEAGWSWTVLRPQVVFGIAIGSNMNALACVAAYAALSKELGMPLRFPGGRTAPWPQASMPGSARWRAGAGLDRPGSGCPSPPCRPRSACASSGWPGRHRASRTARAPG